MKCCCKFMNQLKENLKKPILKEKYDISVQLYKDSDSQKPALSFEANADRQFRLIHLIAITAAVSAAIEIIAACCKPKNN